MPAWLAPAIIAGGSALANWLSNRKSSRESENESSGTSSSSTDSLSTISGQDVGRRAEVFNTQRNLDPQALQFRNLLLNQVLQRVYGGQDLSGNLIQQGLTNVNQGAEAKKKAIQTALAKRGLAYSPAGASAMIGAESERIGQGVNWLNQVPMLTEEILANRIGQANQTLATIPYGTSGMSLAETITDRYLQNQTTSQTNNKFQQKGNAIAPGSAGGSAVSGLAATMAYLYGSGAFQGGSSNNINT